MDNGEEIPALNEEWKFLGAKAFEWVSGFVTMILFNEVLISKSATAMPILLLVLVGTTMMLAGIRSRFPDEERGVRNLLCVAAGVEPPGIPSPAALQPLWSGAPARELRKGCKFEQLGLGELFPIQEESDEDSMLG